MNTALMALATAVFIALSTTAHKRDGNTGSDANNSNAAFEYEKVIHVSGNHDQVCDTTPSKTPISTTVDITVKEGNTY
ncbi:MAG: hypothetical protein V4506_12355 [Bacteroidota bacterium]